MAPFQSVLLSSGAAAVRMMGGEGNGEGLRAANGTVLKTGRRADGGAAGGKGDVARDGTSWSRRNTRKPGVMYS